jgi:DNA repair protein RadA/Sms
LGGGVVPGSLVLLAGEPGVGKSTLLLQLALQVNYPTLYVSGEESLTQIKLRSNRMNNGNSKCFLLNETNVEQILTQANTLKPKLLIVDSIQTLQTDLIDSGAGSVSQVRECTSALQRFAKQMHIPVLVVGHITKDGMIAGPKILEHMVDVVLHFEGDRNYLYRILRTPKNRFGSTAELGIYEMESKGLRIVENPSELLISSSSSNLSGHAIAATLEGMRPMLIECQALVSSAVYGTPQRSSTGFNVKRLNMLLAVLEKRAGFKLGAKDVFLNLAGGIRIEDPALDLAVAAAILSSSLDVVIPEKFCFAAEVGLSGELRNVPRVEQRIQEAEKLGFTTLVVAQKSKLPTSKLKVIALDNIRGLVELLF